MFFREIIRILLPALLLAAFPAAEGATVTTGDGVAIDMDRSSSESLATLDELRALDRQVAVLFRVGGRRLPRQCRIAVSGSVPKGELLMEFKPQEWILAFNDRDGDWLDDFALRRKLIGLLLLARMPGSGPPPDPDFLPGWVAAGIDARIRSAQESESLMRRNRYLPVLRALAENGTFPDFHRMRLLDPQHLPPPALNWFRELGRATLELAALRSSAADNALLDYCILSAQPGGMENRNFLATLGRVFLAGAAGEGIPERVGTERWAGFSEDEKLQFIQEDYARQLAFNSYFPQPVSLLAKSFAGLSPVRLPVLDASGIPTLEFTAFPLDEFPERLLNRTDAEEQRTDLRNRILALREGVDLPFRRLLEELAESVTLLPLRPPARPPEPPSPAARFQLSVARVRADLELRAKIERLLDAVDAEHRVPAEFYGSAIRETNAPSPLLTERMKNFLDRVEREWLDD